MLTTVETMQAATAILTGLGHAATVEYPGYICIDNGAGVLFNFGVMNDPFWGGDACDADTFEYRPYANLTLTTNVPRTSQDAGAIASAIDQRMRNVL